jgi:hypothetical protein
MIEHYHNLTIKSMYTLKFFLVSCFFKQKCAKVELNIANKNRPNFLRLPYLSDMFLSSRKMFHLLLKKIFVFSTTFKLFGTETCVTEI